MGYHERLSELKKEALQMEHHAEDCHPELHWEDAPKGPSGSIKSYPWTQSGDVFVEQGETFSKHGQKR